MVDKPAVPIFLTSVSCKATALPPRCPNACAARHKSSIRKKPSKGQTNCANSHIRVKNSRLSDILVLYERTKLFMFMFASVHLRDANHLCLASDLMEKPGWLWNSITVRDLAFLRRIPKWEIISHSLVLRQYQALGSMTSGADIFAG